MLVFEANIIRCVLLQIISIHAYDMNWKGTETRANPLPWRIEREIKHMMTGGRDW
jgi:hypothetical protein